MFLDYMKGDPSFACPACDTLVYFGSFRLVIHNCSIPPYLAISLRKKNLIYESDKLLLDAVIVREFSDNKTLLSEISLTIKHYSQRTSLTIKHYSQRIL